MAEERKSYKITDPIYGRVITVTTDKPMTAELGMQYLKQTFGGKLTFDDLANDSNYLTDLKAEHYKSSNDKWEGTDEELIEKDFEYWNMVENNLAVGGVELATTFANLDQKDAQRMLRRYDVYDRTAATGEGSRSGWEQFKGVSKAMLTDPTNYAGGIGIFKLLATKLGGKGAMRFILTKIAAPSAIGATYAGVANYENQKMKEQLGERESIDRGELGANIAVGATVGPLATPAVKLIGAAGRVLKPSSWKSGVASTEKAVMETLGGAKAAQEGVIDAGKKELQQGGGHASASEAASAGLSDELAIINKNFDDAYTKLGELDVRPQEINSFLQKIYDSGIKKGALLDLEDAVRLMREGKLSPTDALRQIKRSLGDAGFSGDFKASTNILKRLKEEAQALFTKAAHRSKKGQEAADLDASYSDFLGIDRKIKQAAGSESKVSSLIASITASPKKSSSLIKDYLKDINKIGKHSGNENFANDQIDLLKSSLSEHMFKSQSGAFKSFVGTDSGRKALKQLYPDISEKTFQNWAKILENSSRHGGASTFWGRMLAQVVGGSAGYAAGGGFGLAVGLIGMASILKSAKFQSMAMRVYSKDVIQPKELKRIEVYLIDKGMPEADARSFTKQIAGQVVTQAVAKNPPEIAVQKAEQFNQMFIPTAAAGQ